MTEKKKVIERIEKEPFIPIDEWIPEEKDKIFQHSRGYIILNISPIFGIEDGEMNYFVMSPKRCYNSDTKMKKDKLSIGFRDHNTHYLNYFEKFYDREHYLFNIYAQIKYYLDYIPEYNEENFMNDLNRYIIDFRNAWMLHYHIKQMNKDNYNIHLTYHNNRNPCLEYKDFHAMIFMEISIIQNMIIPLVSHYIFVKKLENTEVKRVLMRAFDYIFVMIYHKYDVDMIAKLYETAISTINKNVNNNKILWDMQEIRGRNSTVQGISTVENIIVQILPKYSYSKNIICFNYNAIIGEIKYKVTDIPYEYALTTVSSSNRDDDNNSESDKFEAHIAKIDEAMILQTNVNCRTTMDKIIQTYGPFYTEEVDFYIRELSKDNKNIKNSFQSNLISYLFLKDFKDTQAIKLINYRDYVVLMIAAKRYLCREGQTLLPYIIGGRVSRLVTRKTVNKKILTRMQICENYPKVEAKYNNDKIQEKIIFKIIAQILASEFCNIDYYNQDLNGIQIQCIPEKICEEILQYVLMI